MQRGVPQVVVDFLVRVISPALDLGGRPRYGDGANGAALGDWGLETGVDLCLGTHTHTLVHRN